MKKTFKEKIPFLLLRVMFLILFITPLSSCLIEPGIMNGVILADHSGDDLMDSGCVSIKTIFNPPVSNWLMLEEYGPNNIYQPTPPADGPRYMADPANIIYEKLGIVTWAYYKISTILSRVSEAMFKSVVDDDGFQKFLNVSLVLVLIFYGVGMLIGTANISPYGTFMLIIKILLVYIFIQFWDEIFNPFVIQPFEGLVRGLSSFTSNLFGGTAAPIFTQVTSNTGAELTGAYYDSFAHMDKIVSILLDYNFFTLIMALFLTFWTGWLYALLFIFLILIFLRSLVEAMKVLMISMVIRYIFYAMAPIFLVLALFSQTRQFFDGWLEQLISFSLQPIFVMAFVAIFSNIIIDFMSGAVTSDKSVCYTELFKFGDLMSLYWWRIIYPEKNISGAIESNVPLDLWYIIIIIIIAYLMKVMVAWAVEVANNLANGFVSSVDIGAHGGGLAKALATTPAFMAVGAFRGAVKGSRDAQGEKVGRGGAGAWQELKNAAHVQKKIIYSELDNFLFEGSPAFSHEVKSDQRKRRKQILDDTDKEFENPELNTFKKGSGFDDYRPSSGGTGSGTGGQDNSGDTSSRSPLRNINAKDTTSKSPLRQFNEGDKDAALPKGYKPPNDTASRSPLRNVPGSKDEIETQAQPRGYKPKPDDKK